MLPLRPCCGSPPSHSPSGKIETIHTFGWYLRKMIDDAKAKGVHPILLTPTIRNIWTTVPDGKPHIEHDMGCNDWVRQTAAQEQIPVLELEEVEANRLEALGPEKSAPLFPKDHTHTSAEGADLVAQCVAITIRTSNDPLSHYLRPAS
jgi:lysophospholipase L1-like esterase